MDGRRMRALKLAKGQSAIVANISRVADEVGPDAASWAFSQWALRKKAEAKFSRASEMLFVREALEQATHESVAKYHASLFPTGEKVADLTVGIGADLIAIAERGLAIGYELDQERLDCAAHNLAVYGLDANLQQTDSLSVEWNFEFAYADPSRRVEGRRTLDLDQFSPDPRVLAEKMSFLQLGVMKLSPMLSDDELARLSDSMEFISFGRECRESLLQFGTDRKPGRRAVHVESRLTLDATEFYSPPAEPGAFVFDADPAAIRAHCLGSLCELTGLRPLGDSLGFLTGSNVDSPWIRKYQIIAEHPFDRKTIRSEARKQGWRITAIKPRGIRLNVAALEKEISPKEGIPVTLFIYPACGRFRALVAVPA